MKYVYKIVAALAALSVIVLAIFMPLVHIDFESMIPSALLTIGALLKSDVATDLLKENGGDLPSGITDDIAISDFFSPDSNSVASLISEIDFDSSESVSEALKPIISPAITLAVIFGLIIICAIVTAVLAFAVKDNRKVIYSSVTGIGLSLMLAEAFEAVAAPFVDGTITLASLTGSSWASLLGSVKEVDLISTFWFIPVAFACVILWTVLYNATLPEDEKAKRKEMLGEAK